MKVELDLISCKDTGECVINAPHVFSVDDRGVQTLRFGATGTVVTIEVSDEFGQEVEEAAIVCPMQAISIVG
ncbi:MAG: ferredoxin [Actinomycetota bacterium]